MTEAGAKEHDPLLRSEAKVIVADLTSHAKTPTNRVRTDH